MCVCVCACVYMYVCVCVGVMCMCVCVRACVRVRVHVFARACVVCGWHSSTNAHTPTDRRPHATAAVHVRPGPREVRGVAERAGAVTRRQASQRRPAGGGCNRKYQDNKASLCVSLWHKKKKKGGGEKVIAVQTGVGARARHVEWSR